MLLFLILSGLEKYRCLKETVQRDARDEFCSNEEVIQHIGLLKISERERARKIYIFLNENIEHVVSYSSFWRNPLSHIIDRVVFAPMYLLVSGRESLFLNTVIEPYQLIDRREGICHQQAIAFARLAEEAGIKSRTIWLEGHVVAEVFYEEKWHMFDPDCGVVFEENGDVLSYQDVISSPEKIEKAYAESNCREGSGMREIFITQENNRFFDDFYPHRPFLNAYYLVTTIASYGVYGLILAGIVYLPIRYWRIRRRDSEKGTIVS